MLFRVYSAAVFGIKAYPVFVEVDFSSGRKLELKKEDRCSIRIFILI
jgi:hypothetical protein